MANVCRRNAVLLSRRSNNSNNEGRSIRALESKQNPRTPARRNNPSDAQLLLLDGSWLCKPKTNEKIFAALCMPNIKKINEIKYIVCKK